MSATILLSRYRKLRQTYSLPQLILKLFCKVWEKVFTIHHAALREWVAPPADPDSDNPVFLATEEDIDESYQDLWYSREQAIELIRQGHQLFLWKENGKIIFYQWLRRNDVDIPHLDMYHIKVPKQVAYAASAYVPPECNGRLLLKRAQRYMEARSSEADVHYLFALTDLKSEAINRYHERILKTKKYQTVTYVRILFLKLYRVTSANGEEHKWFINTNAFWNEYSSYLKG